MRLLYSLLLVTCGKIFKKKKKPHGFGVSQIDHNFLVGLCSLIKMISEILTSPDENPNRSCLQEYEKNHFYSDGTIE